jgi:hypothetical protein
MKDRRATLLAFALAASVGCGTAKKGGGFGSPAGGDDASSGVAGDDASGGTTGDGGGLNLGGTHGGGADASAGVACSGTGLCTLVPPGCTTSVSGTVYDPAGLNPLYNVVVFVPNDPAGKLPAIQTGTHSCNTCDVSIGNYVAATVTDAKGHFTLKNVPATTHVPLVVQTGKWRREVFLPTIKACTNTAVPADSSRLPRSKSEGDLPQMALLTGGCDDTACFLRNVGIADSEITNPGGGGRVDIYQGVGGATLASGTPGNCTGAACPLWASKQSLEPYDIALLTCECGENQQTKSAAGMQALHDWLSEGGKVFASHFHYIWFKAGPADFQGVANWLGFSPALGMGNYSLDTTFPKGMTYHDWLANVGALNPDGTITLSSVAASVSTVNPPTQRWIYDSATSHTSYLSFLTPIGGLPKPADGGAEKGPQYCGKAVFTDLHMSGQFGGSPVTNIPGGCPAGPLTPLQKALEFLFFDLSACVAPENQAPPPPPPPTPQ